MSAIIELKTTEMDLLAEALAMAASRHDSMGHVTKGKFRHRHFDKAVRMHALRNWLRKESNVAKGR